MKAPDPVAVTPIDKSPQTSDRPHRNKINPTGEPEKYAVLVLGAGTGGKLIAWTMAKQSKRTTSIERKYIGGACPNIACLPSKNIIHSAKVASLSGRHQEFGIET
jgi:pyruvate/2-oxoglutarate dehydrogenase complex dihydrolipoamide dehydrogenase (E3) component